MKLTKQFVEKELTFDTRIMAGFIPVNNPQLPYPPVFFHHNHPPPPNLFLFWNRRGQQIVDNNDKKYLLRYQSPTTLIRYYRCNKYANPFIKCPAQFHMDMWNLVIDHENLDNHNHGNPDTPYLMSNRTLMILLSLSVLLNVVFMLFYLGLDQ